MTCDATAKALTGTMKAPTTRLRTGSKCLRTTISGGSSSL